MFFPKSILHHSATLIFDIFTLNLAKEYFLSTTLINSKHSLFLCTFLVNYIILQIFNEFKKSIPSMSCLSFFLDNFIRSLHYCSISRNSCIAKINSIPIIKVILSSLFDIFYQIIISQMCSNNSLIQSLAIKSIVGILIIKEKEHIVCQLGYQLESE